MNRRRFLVASTTALAALGALAAFTAPRLLSAADCGHDGHGAHEGYDAGGTSAVKHPDPRQDVTADAVLPDDQVPEKSKEAYAAAREFPAIMDGLYCHCDCAERDGLRSLLSCFETKMPQSCGFCRGEATMAAKLARDGKTLDEIRKAVDERYG